MGSGPENVISLTDSAVSQSHALVRSTPDGIMITDTGSTNGTIVDGARVRVAFVSRGSRVHVGRTTLVLQEAVLPQARVEPERLAGMIGHSEVMRQVFELIRRVASCDVTALLLGETGTGKDVAARAIHELSSRRSRPFVVLDGAALDRDLVSAELFGHEAGAFTGAHGARPGAFEQAQGGTLFLDEIGELPLDLQPKLLRALEAREVRRLGSSRSLKFDCRLIAATHRDLRTMSLDGRFRQDLYFRLSAIEIALPPLRERRADIPDLAREILGRLHSQRGGPDQLDPEALDALSRAALPGNVRELRNVLERAHLMAPGRSISRRDLVLPRVGQVVEASEVSGRDRAGPGEDFTPNGRGDGPESLTPLERAQRLAIVQALETHHYNRSRAARDLGLSLPTLRKRIRIYGIPVPGGQDGS